ncbi:MAG TPA: FxLYD domain-containing protein [Verrucomicrobiae bacterium]|jgi:hypothetical protein
MEGISPTKTCPLCAEPVNAAAKVCPHCRHWLKKWSIPSPYFSGIVAMTVWILAMVALMAFMEKAFGPKTDFAEYHDQISVLNSQFSQQMRESNLWNTVVGTLTNSSKASWKDVEVEAQFFNKSGTMIDAITVKDNYIGIVILPHGEAAFKIDGRAVCPAIDYATNKLYVRWAKDANSLF